MYYYGFRFYEPNLQRWINQDPIHERGGINLFRFVGNRPINYYDSRGLAIGDNWDPRTWFNDGFTGSWTDESSSIVNTWGDVSSGDWGDIANNYDTSSLGQAENLGSGYYTAEKNLLAVAAAASLSALDPASLQAYLFLADEAANNNSDHNNVSCPTAVGGTKSRTNWGPEHGTGNVEHNNSVESELDEAAQRGASDLRKNRVQRDVNGDRVYSDDGSFTKPDASYVDGGQRINYNRVADLDNLQREIDAFNKMIEADPEAIHVIEF